jgi:hypothetical protein
MKADKADKEATQTPNNISLLVAGEMSFENIHTVNCNYFANPGKPVVTKCFKLMMD